jgi:hypothetical protein
VLLGDGPPFALGVGARVFELTCNRLGLVGNAILIGDLRA